MEAVFAEIIERLAAGEPAVVDAFCPLDLVAALTTDLEHRRAAGELHRARVGRGGGAQLSDTVRRDEICWWKDDDLSDAQRSFVHRIDALRSALNQSLFVGAREFEAHYAIYAPGSFYARHRDRFASDDARVLSAILYLDGEWRKEDGGQLFLHGTPAREVFPAAGRLVCFQSDRHEHEVRETRRERRSVALWFRRSILATI